MTVEVRIAFLPKADALRSSESPGLFLRVSGVDKRTKAQRMKKIKVQRGRFPLIVLGLIYGRLSSFRKFFAPFASKKKLRFLLT